MRSLKTKTTSLWDFSKEKQQKDKQGEKQK